MTDRLDLFLAMLTGGGLFAVLGAVFGAIVGAVTWGGGRAAGTTLGLSVARAFERGADRAFTPIVTGTIVGGVDGFVFLGLLGTLLGAVATGYGRSMIEIVHPAGTIALSLASAAAFFGALAHGIVRGGTRTVLAIFVSAAVGASIGLALRGDYGLLPGTMVGVIAGTIVGLIVRPN